MSSLRTQFIEFYKVIKFNPMLYRWENRGPKRFRDMLKVTSSFSGWLKALGSSILVPEYRTNWLSAFSSASCFTEIQELFKLARVVCTYTKWPETVVLWEFVVCWLVSIFLPPCLSSQQLSLLKRVLIPRCPPFQSVMAYEIRQKLTEAEFT